MKQMKVACAVNWETVYLLTRKKKILVVNRVGGRTPLPNFSGGGGGGLFRSNVSCAYSQRLWSNRKNVINFSEEKICGFIIN